MAKVLYISYDGMTDSLGQSQVIPYLKGLSKKGHEITIISAEKKINLSLNFERISNELKKNNIQWLFIHYRKWPPVISTLIDVYRIYKLADKTVKKEHPDIIHCRSYIAALIGNRIKKKYKTKFVFDIRGFWIEERIEGKIWNLNNPLYSLIHSFFKKKEISFFKNADFIISLTESAKKIIHTLNLPLDRPVAVIPCCADLSLFSPKYAEENQRQALRSSLSIPSESFVMSYLGSIGTWYMLDEMLDFFKVLLDSKPAAVFLFISNEPKENILKRADAKGIDKRKIIITSAPHQKVPLYISLSDLSIFFIRPTFSKKASSPTKLGELAGMEIPVITNSGIGDVDEIINSSKIGYCLPAFSPKAYAEAVARIEQLLLTPKEKFKDAAQKYFALENGVKTYNDIYNKLTVKN